jgi:hypothetical protein
MGQDSESDSSSAASRRTDASRPTVPERAVTSPGKAEHLDLVATAVAAFEAARDTLEAAVRAALRHGATWSEIGGLLGISRQAAFHRYGPKQSGRAQPDRDH